MLLFLMSKVKSIHKYFLATNWAADSVKFETESNAWNSYFRKMLNVAVFQISFAPNIILNNEGVFKNTLNISSSHRKCSLILSKMGFFGTAHGWEGPKRPSLPKICHTYPTMMKLATVIPYLKKIQKIYESRDTPPEFRWHQQFFTGNQQILLYQEIHV